MDVNNKLFNTIEEVLNAGDFYEIYEQNGEKRIVFCGYIYTEGEPGTDENGEFDESLCYRVVEYSSGMDFLLEEYLAMDDEARDYAYDIRGNDYIGDVTEGDAFEIANSWFGKDVKISKVEPTINMPVGYYVK